MRALLQIFLFTAPNVKWSIKKTVKNTNLIGNALVSSFCPFEKNRNKNCIFNRLLVAKRYFCCVHDESCSASKACWSQWIFLMEFSCILLFLRYQKNNFSQMFFGKIKKFKTFILKLVKNMARGITSVKIWNKTVHASKSIVFSTSYFISPTFV